MSLRAAADVLAFGLSWALLACTASPEPAGEGSDQAGAGSGGTGSGASAGASGVAAEGGVGGGAGGGAGAAGVAGGGAGAAGAAADRAGAGGTSGSSGAGGSGIGGAAGSVGAGGGSAGSGGVAGTNVEPGTSCADAGYLICEDFEAAPLDGTPDGWTKHGDASGVVDDVFHAGTRALRLGPIAVWERRIYRDASALGSAHWGRIWFRVELPVPDAFVHSTLVALSGEGPTRGASEYRVVDTVKQAADTPDVGSRIQFLWNVQPQSSGEFGEGTAYDREFDDAWHCAEWRVDATDQSYAFYLDGEELIAFENGAGNFDGTDIPTRFDELKVGWINYQEAPPGFTAFVDDVALDDARIGCD